jgi:Zn-dependent protease
VRQAYNPFYVPQPDQHAGRPRITFSRDEVLHLAGAVAILTLCFAFAQQKGVSLAPGGFRFPPAIDLLASFLAVGSGFVLHELAHKVVAQRYGHWAEFRAQFMTLLVSLALAVGAGFLVAAPGAVVIQGNVTRKENGLISLVGPGTNLVIGLATFPFALAVDTSRPLPHVMGTVCFANAILCLFNLIPLGPLDGRKVLRWNAWAYCAVVACALGLLGLLFVRGVI